ncbi:collagen alpha-1(XX) chain-like isoform X2 [Mytilus californianus]|uniref:collagen alpha-1(XX) chain-like isoform X2 n=1 Tax=Mytilus californianus TaxID=6549 RepID=UPI002246A85E|nr:collagen alpha-1(XX) chain-like isoform X2 [Mytilus californianus]
MEKLVIILCTTLCITLFINRTQSTKNDITFLVDTTGDVTQDEFKQVIDFIYNITSRLAIGPEDNRVALVTFNTIPTTQFDLNDISGKVSLLNAIISTKNYNLTGTRETHKALSHIEDNIYVSSSGMRTDAQSSLLLITYGQSQSPTQTQFAAYVLKSTVQAIYVIGVGSLMYDQTERSDFPNIASSIENIFYIEEVSILCNYILSITIKLDLNATQSEVVGCSPITTTWTTISTTIPTTTEMKTTELTYSTELTDSTSTDLTYSTESLSQEKTSLKLDTDNGTTASHLNGCVVCYPATTELTSTEKTVSKINKGLPAVIMIGILLSCLLSLVLVALVLYLLCNRKRRNNREEKIDHDSTIENAEKVTMTQL